MATPSDPRIAFAVEVFRTLAAPILLLVLGICMLVYDGILRPPADPQGTSGLAIVLIVLALGRGADKIKGML